MKELTKSEAAEIIIEGEIIVEAYLSGTDTSDLGEEYTTVLEYKGESYKVVYYFDETEVQEQPDNYDWSVQSVQAIYHDDYQVY